MSHQHATIGDTVYFWFASNDTSGSGNDGASAVFDVREAGAASNAAPLLSGSATLLSHADYQAGCYEIAVAATVGNGFAAGDTFAVFCTLTVDSQNPSGFVGSCTLSPIIANTTQIEGADASTTIIGADSDTLETLSDQIDTVITEVGNLAVGSGGIATTAESFTKAGAEPETNTYTATIQEDGTYHIVEDDTTSTDCYYQFDVGPDGVPQSIEWYGYAQSQGDSYAISFYNWASTSWDQVGTINGANGSTPFARSFTATIAHVGSGSNVGKVRFRFSSSDGTAFATDRLICVYTQISQGITNGSTITLSSSTTDQNFLGHNWTLALGGQDISGSYFYQSINVSGTGTATNGSPFTFQECNFPSATLSAYGFIENSAISALTFTSTAGVSADTIDLFHCYSGVAGSGAPTFDFSGVTKTTNIQVRKWSGGGTWTFTSDCVASIEVEQGGTHTITTGGGNVELRGIIKTAAITSSGSSTTNIHGIVGSVTVAGTGGTVNIYGAHGTVTDSSGGNVTVNDYGIDNLPVRIQKNVALSNFTFYMVKDDDHVTAATGKTITAQISKDGGAFASCSNSVSEIGSGHYKIDLTQTEMNADIISLKFTADRCDQRAITIVTDS